MRSSLFLLLLISKCLTADEFSPPAIDIYIPVNNVEFPEMEDRPIEVDTKLPSEVEISCSNLSKSVAGLLNPVLDARQSDNVRFESLLFELHSNKSLSASEAIVRLESIYLGSWPGTANECELYFRGESVIPILKDPENCLDERVVNEKLLSDYTENQVYESKLGIVSKIRQPIDGWCQFD